MMNVSTLSCQYSLNSISMHKVDYQDDSLVCEIEEEDDEGENIDELENDEVSL
jgi:hypothetical protein